MGVSPIHRASAAGGAKQAGGGARLGEADEKDGVIFPRKEKPCEGVAGGVGSHHAGADEVNLAGLGPEGGETAWIKSFRTDFRNNFEAGVLAGG